MADVLAAVSPIDGDPDRIQSYSGYYKSISEAIIATENNLASLISSSDTESEAVAAFIEVATEVRGHLLEVDERYETLAAQLASYAIHLRTFQGEADTMMTTARNAHDGYDTARWRVASLRDQIASLEPDDPQLPGLRYNLDQHESTVAWIESVVANKNVELDELLDKWRRTADSIATAIDKSVDGSPLNDSGWDKFLDFLETMVTEILPIIEMVLDILALVLTIAAFILALTGVGAPLAAALFAVARVAQVISKIIKIVRITITLMLVATGTMAPTALIDLALDMALDKFLGKMGDSLGDGALAALKNSPVGTMLAEGAEKKGSLFLTQNLDQMVNGGFDEWANNGFKEFMEVGFEDGAAWVGSTMDWVEAPLGAADTALDAFMASHGFVFPSGPDLPHGAGDFKGLGWDLVETSIGDIAVGDGAVRDYINIPDLSDVRSAVYGSDNPSANSLIGANS